MALRRLVLVIAAAALAACGSGGNTAASAGLSSNGDRRDGGPGKPLTVMTRNLFVGGDLFLPFVSPDPLAAASTVWGDILASDVPGRMMGIAEEIRAARPDLVGLQEVYRFVVTPLGESAPVLLDLDFLALLEGALESPGHWDGDLDGRDDDVPGNGRWSVAAQQEHTILTVPFPEQGVQITMIDRDAILVGPGVHVLATSGGHFAAEFVTTLAGVIPVHQRRGWVEADVRRRGVELKFVNVHLEVKEFGPLQSAQTQELLGRFAGLAPVVLVGDFNSSPVDPAYVVSPVTIPTPYQLLAGAFTDVWDAVGVGTGLTCCFPPDLTPPGELFERVDLVWFHGAFTPVAAYRTGLEPLAALGGRWPSDHAGVVAKLRIQKPHHDGDDDGDGEDVYADGRRRR